QGGHRDQQPLPHADRSARDAARRAARSGDVTREAARQCEPIPDSGGAAVGRAGPPGRARVQHRSLSTVITGVLDGEGRLRTRRGRGRTPMRTTHTNTTVKTGTVQTGKGAL